MSRLFRRRPAPEPPDVLAVYLDELALAYTRTPGLVVSLLIAHADALFHEDVALETAPTQAESVEAANRADRTRGDLFAVSRTAPKWARRITRKEVIS